MTERRAAIAPITRVGAGTSKSDHDLVAVEAPVRLDVHSADGLVQRSLGVLMRTPGDDDDLVLGLLLTEGVIRHASDLIDLRARGDNSTAADSLPATLVARVAPSVNLDDWAADRATLSTSACGLCGRLEVQSVNALATRARAGEMTIAAATIALLPARLRDGQTVFEETGGLHAAGLFTSEGHPMTVREDVGRHNAVDKVIGASLSGGVLANPGLILVVSGRVAFEIVQKAVMAGLRCIVAVGAPSNLAVEAARATGTTLVGFVRDGRFNVYAGGERIRY